MNRRDLRIIHAPSAGILIHQGEKERKKCGTMRGPAPGGGWKAPRNFYIDFLSEEDDNCASNQFEQEGMHEKTDFWRDRSRVRRGIDAVPEPGGDDLEQ
jgi:hypothetical protein